MRLSLLRFAKVKYYRDTESFFKEGEKIMDEKREHGLISLLFVGFVGGMCYLMQKHSEPPKKVKYI